MLTLISSAIPIGSFPSVIGLLSTFFLFPPPYSLPPLHPFSLVNLLFLFHNKLFLLLSWSPLVEESSIRIMNGVPFHSAFCLFFSFLPLVSQFPLLFENVIPSYGCISFSFFLIPLPLGLSPESWFPCNYDSFFSPFIFPPLILP